VEQVFGVFYLVALGVFGLVFGSFANVVIWRLPRGESIAFPGSHCPGCGAPIRPSDNVPIVSWLLLRGRCRGCRNPIHWRYPVVEAFSGALWLVAGLRFGFTPQAAVAVLLFYVLLILAFIDLDTMRLPNVLVALLAAVGLVAVLLSEFGGATLAPLTGVAPAGPLSHPLAVALVGLAVGGGLLGGVGVIYSRVRGRSGLGAGDIKLMGVAGLFVGPYVLLALLVGSALGLVAGLSFVIKPSAETSAEPEVEQLSAEELRPAVAGAGVVVETDTVVAEADAEESRLLARIPFGPFLAVGVVVATLYGPALWSAYLALLHV
jgi:leader peptidase (prepilin peptidase) / N-methyltransferase